MRLLFLIVLAVLVAGCSFWQHTETQRQRMAVEYAVLKVTEGEAERKARVVEVVGEVRQSIDRAQKVTVSDLFEEVERLIDWQRLDPGQQFLLREVLVTAEQRVQEQVGSGPIVGPRKLKVETLLDWIEQAAS